MFRTVLALLLALLSSADAVLQSSDSYSFDSAYADAVAAKVECFISNAWPPLEAISSSFKMDFSSAPRADSPSQVHDNITKALLFYTFRSTPAEFDGIFVGFENAKFINLRRSTARLDRNIYLWYIKDENSTCGKPYNISSYCTLMYENSTSPYNGAVGKPSGATSYNTRNRPWYIGAKADTTYDGTFWTDVYGYAGGGIGITAAQQLLSSSGSLLGVAGIDIKLTQLSSILSGKFVHENLQNVYVGNGVDEPTFTAFIVDASGNLVSASQDGYSFRNDSQVPAYNCSYKTIAKAARFYTSRYKGYADDRVLTLVDHKKRLNWARSTAYADSHGLKWYIVLVQIVNCPFNYFEYNSTCKKCPFPRTSEGGHYSTSCDFCVDGYFMNAAGHCIRCKGSMICDKYGVTIQSLRIQSGWYRFSEDSHRVYECPHPQNCVGNTTAGDTLCLRGSFGPLCGLCKDDFYLDPGTKACKNCRATGANQEMVTFYIILGVICIVGVAILAGRHQLKEFFHEHRDTLMRSKNKITALIVSMQIISILREGQEDIGGRPLPEPFQGFLLSMNFLGLDLMEITSLACINGRVAQFPALLTWTIGPTALVIVVAITAYCMHHPRSKKAKVKLLRSTTFVVMLLLPVISRTILQTFRCISYSDGSSSVVRVQMVDPNVDCDDASGPYDAMVIYAAINIFIWPVGVPVGLMVWLRSIAQHLNPHGVPEAEAIKLRLTNEHVKNSAVAGFALKYKPRYWYYELGVNLPRRLLLTCVVLIFTTRGPFLLFILTVSVTTTIAEREMHPFVDRFLGTFVYLNSWMILTVVMGMLLMEQENIPDALVGGILLVLNVAMLIGVYTDTYGVDVEGAGVASSGSPSKVPSPAVRSKNKVRPADEYHTMKQTLHTSPSTLSNVAKGNHQQHQHQQQEEMYLGDSRPAVRVSPAAERPRPSAVEPWRPDGRPMGRPPGRGASAVWASMRVKR